jgi:RNA polymerase sigma-70 factor (ECF subfamily)
MAAYGALSDLELTALLKEGDHTAFTEIYNRYWSVLYLHARHMVKNQDYAGDAVQEVFTVIWNKAKDIELSVGLSAYLYRAVRNSILNMIRKGKLEGDYKMKLAEFYAKGEYNTDDQVNFNELKSLIEREVQLLPKKMREVFELSRNQNLSHAEIASRLDMNDEAVKRQISRALVILRKKLGFSATIILLYLSGN